MSKVSTVAVPSHETIMVEVNAPSDMPAGYKFEAEYNGKTFPVTVPPGGVVAGQKLSVPFVPNDSGDDKILNGKPMGRWDDDLCDCCRFGCCHPSLCCAMWCQPCGMAQVMTRLKLNMCGTPAKSEMEWRNTFRNVFILCVIMYIVNSVLNTLNQDENNHIIFIILEDVLDIAFTVYIVLVLVRVRFLVREMYAIPPGCCGGCNDCCCAFWCTCCVTSQLARQTADYDKQPAKCCNSTGLGPQVV